MSDQTNRGRLAISMPDLHRLLGLPDTVQITEVKRISSLDGIEIEVRGAALPLVDAFHEPRVIPIEVLPNLTDGVYAEYDRTRLLGGEPSE